jgi:hypothetical protein
MVRKTKLEMSTDHRMGAFLMLWESQIDGRPTRGAVRRLAIQFDVDVSTINRLWRGTKNKIDARLNVVQNGAPIDTVNPWNIGGGSGSSSADDEEDHNVDFLVTPPDSPQSWFLF